MVNDFTSPFIRSADADSIRQRWGEAVDAGFTPIPNSLIRAQSRLELSANDVVVLANLLLHWWKEDRWPFPHSRTIARRSGLSHRTVQRTLSALQGKGLLKRVRQGGRDGATMYDLSGLKTALAKEARADSQYRPDLVE